MSGTLEQLCQDVALAKDLHLDTIHFYFAAAVTTVDHDVADSDAHLTTIAAIEQLAWANGDNLAALWLLTSRIGKHDAARCRRFCFAWLNDNSIIEGTETGLGKDLRCHSVNLPKF